MGCFELVGMMPTDVADAPGVELTFRAPVDVRQASGVLLGRSSDSAELLKAGLIDREHALPSQDGGADTIQLFTIDDEEQLFATGQAQSCDVLARTLGVRWTPSSANIVASRFKRLAT